MPETIGVDPAARRADVREKYGEVALHPDGEFHVHTGRPLAALLGYPAAVVDSLPDRAVELRDDWCAAIEAAGFDAISVGLAVDAFGGSGGEPSARAYDVAAHVFLASRPATA